MTSSLVKIVLTSATLLNYRPVLVGADAIRVQVVECIENCNMSMLPTRFFQHITLT